MGGRRGTFIGDTGDHCYNGSTLNGRGCRGACNEGREGAWDGGDTYRVGECIVSCRNMGMHVG